MSILQRTETDLDLHYDRSEDFIPTETEIQRAHQLQQELLANATTIEESFERQMLILLELRENPRLCRALDFDNVWQFLQDPEVKASLRITIGSEPQLYRMLRLAKVHRIFPRLGILRAPHLTKFTHTDVLNRLEGLLPGQDEEAQKLVDEAVCTPIQRLQGEPGREIRTKGDVVLIDGEPILKVKQWSPLAIRAVSLLLHMSPAPSFELNVEEKTITGWSDGRAETIFEILTENEGVFEYLQKRLHAIRK